MSLNQLLPYYFSNFLISVSRGTPSSALLLYLRPFRNIIMAVSCSNRRGIEKFNRSTPTNYHRQVSGLRFPVWFRSYCCSLMTPALPRPLIPPWPNSLSSRYHLRSPYNQGMEWMSMTISLFSDLKPHSLSPLIKSLRFSLWPPDKPHSPTPDVSDIALPTPTTRSSETECNLGSQDEPTMI
jgi:hypothetical protein